MDDILVELYPGNYNNAAVDGIIGLAEKLAEVYGEEAVDAFEQWLDTIPAEEIFAFPDVEKVASEVDGAVLEKLAELDAQGRIFAHAFMDELSKVASVGQTVQAALAEAFLEAIVG